MTTVEAKNMEAAQVHQGMPQGYDYGNAAMQHPQQMYMPSPMAVHSGMNDGSAGEIPAALDITTKVVAGINIGCCGVCCGLGGVWYIIWMGLLSVASFPAYGILSIATGLVALIAGAANVASGTLVIIFNKDDTKRNMIYVALGLIGLAWLVTLSNLVFDVVFTSVFDVYGPFVKHQQKEIVKQQNQIVSYDDMEKRVNDTKSTMWMFTLAQGFVGLVVSTIWYGAFAGLTAACTMDRFRK